VKLGGGLNYVTGPMGAGKSLYGVRRVVRAVTSGTFVVTNVELYPDAFERVARHVAPWRTGLARKRLAARFERFYVFERELEEARWWWSRPRRGDYDPRAIFVWDETHNDLNNRSWKTDGRNEILEWATQLRKLGFIGFLLSQHADNTDAALRRVCNFQVRLQNQRDQVRVMGMRVTPWPLFLGAWYPANLAVGRAAKPMSVERYFLTWHRHLYDTHGLYHGLAGHEEFADPRVKWLEDRLAPPALLPPLAAESAGVLPELLP
jgi:hypothetical protein